MHRFFEITTFLNFRPFQYRHDGLYEMELAITNEGPSETLSFAIGVKGLRGLMGRHTGNVPLSEVSRFTVDPKEKEDESNPFVPATGTLHFNRAVPITYDASSAHPNACIETSGLTLKFKSNADLLKAQFLFMQAGVSSVVPPPALF